MTSACESSTFCAFLFTVMPMPWERRPHFALEKGDALNLNKKPLPGKWFPRNGFRASALISTYLLPVFGQFRDIGVTVACKQRAEWTFLSKPETSESRPNSSTGRGDPMLRRPTP